MALMYTFHKIKSTEAHQIFEMLKIASLNLKERGIDHWQYWQDPPTSKITWVLEGLAQGQFYSILYKDVKIGMFRLMDEDLLYWGHQAESAKYLHSLVILPEYNGLSHGENVLNQIKKTIAKENIKYFRLDCSAENTSLCNYYLKQGFEKVRVISMSNGNYQLFQKEIS